MYVHMCALQQLVYMNVCLYVCWYVHMHAGQQNGEVRLGWIILG
jgi:hypothetical protein